MPSAPPDVSVSSETATSALVTWSRPLRPNGVVTGYRVYRRAAGSTEVATLHSRDSEVSHRLQGLQPATNYSVWVKAFTPQHEGLASPRTQLVTEPPRPPAPGPPGLACLQPRGLRVVWGGGEQLYMVRVGEQRITVAAHQLTLTNLTLGREYGVEVRAGVVSVHRRGEVRWGPWGISRTITLSPECREEGLEVAVVAGVVGTLVLLGTVVLVLLVYRRFCLESYYYLEEGSVGSSPSTTSLGREAEGGMAPHQFLLHLEVVHRDERAGLRAELAGLLAALHHGRETDWVEGWGAPLWLVPRERPSATALWQRVVGEGLAVVVEMDTECSVYWPEVGGRQEWGEVEVLCLSTTRLGSYVLRNLKVGSCDVVLLHLTTSPAPLPLLSLARAARTAAGREGRTVVLGASAGLYTALDTSLRQLRATGTVGAMPGLRQAAMAGRVLVSREEELSLLLTTLGEAVCAGETWVRRSYLPRYVAGLVAGQGEALARQWALVVGRAGEQAATLAPGATWLPGLHGPGEFLLASPPCPAATPQFWRLLWDCGVHTVLLLGRTPLEGAAGEDGVTVTHWEDELSSKGRAQNYVLEDQQGGRKVVKLLQQDEFLSTESSPEAALALVDSVHARQEQLPRAPLLIVAEKAEPAAAFSVLSTLLRQVEVEGAADVYTVARGVEALLPGAFPSPAALLRVYR